MSFTSDDLREIEIFAQLTPEQLAAIAGQVSEARLAPGELLFTETDFADQFYVLIEGELQITKQVGREEMVLDHLLPGAYFGEIPILTNRPYRVNGRTRVPSRFATLDKPGFFQLLTSNEATASEIVLTVARRVRSAEVLVQQRERSVALGEFAAELAHELNNPAAAARRNVDHLQTAFDDAQRLAFCLARRDLRPEQLDALAALERAARERTVDQAALDPLTASDREDTLLSWLDARGVEDGWEFAATLVEAGVDVGDLAELDAAQLGEALGDGLHWLAATLAASRLLDQARQGTRRMSELVDAVKRYAYMDQAPRQEVDVHEGIESTLTILRHKVGSGVSIQRDFGRDVPCVSAYASELNQVWTNLLENALDALDGNGEITVRTRLEGRHVVVEIQDDGPGIAPELQSRIFNPFFTTKGAKGAGLGLDIARRILVQRHGGELSVESQPGDTRFTVRLPIDS